MHSIFYLPRRIVVLFWAFLFFTTTLPAATLTVSINKLGATPELIAYNSGHFAPLSNTEDWWHYAGVGGARVFLTASVIEPNDDLPARGDGVTNQASFVSRKAALRINPLDTNYINWPYLIPQFGVTALHGSNLLNVDHACTKLRGLGVQILINITASPGQFDIIDTNDWAGKWELWQHFYFEAFYLGREYDVERFQMYNEPDLGGTLPQADYLMRLQLASDAVQSALADVNQLYGKSLKARMLAPVTAGAVSTTYATWGRLIVTNRHKDFLGQVDTNFSLIGQYDYHEYNSVPSTFGSRVAGLHASLTADMSPEPRYPSSLSEFNVHTAGVFDTLIETLDTPSKYARFGSIVANLVNNFVNELYCFKFSQTSTPVKKNGMHFVDNFNAPYNIGGITKAGEVYRLFNKVTAPGRDRVDVTKGTGATGLDLVSTFDPATKRYQVFSANNSSSNVDVTLDTTSWGLRTGQRVLLEEVSENIYGGARALLTVANNQINAGIHASNTVWLFTIPTQPQQPLRTLLATDDAMVHDGANRTLNFATNPVCLVRNNSTNASSRSATFLKFHLPTFNLADLQFALLTIRASSINGSNLVQAHVYGITNNNWSQNSLTWSNAPNLKQNIPPGTNYTNNFISEQGTGAQIVGQFVADATSQDRMIDVTRFLREHPGSDVSFLLAREVRFQGDTQDADSLSIVSGEANANTGPRLILVTGTPAPPSITQQPIGQTVVESQSVTFTVTASSSTPITYQWRFRGADISDATNSTYTLTNVTTNDAGEHSVVLSNPIGSVSSDAALLVVNLYLRSYVNPPTGGTITVTPDQSGYDAGSMVSLNATASAGFSFVGWSGDVVTTSNQIDVTMTRSKTLFANFISVADIILDNPDARFDGVWTTATAAPDKYGSYYQYASTVIGSATASSTYTPAIPLAGMYDISISYPQGTNRSSNTRLLIVFNGDSLVTHINQTTGGGGWRLLTTREFAGGTNGYVEIENNTGEINKLVVADAMRFSYSTAPIIYSQPQLQNVRASSNATFTVLAAGSGQLTYQWQFNEANIAGATNSSYARTNVQTADIGGYTVVISNPAGSIISDIAALTILPLTRLSSISVLSDGRFHFTLSGESDLPYSIEVSTNLFDWQTLTNLSSRGGTIDFVDPIPRLDQRFYRARGSP